MSDPVVLIIVASNARQGHEVVAKRPPQFSQPIRLRSLLGLRAKLRYHPAAFLLLVWHTTDGEASLRTLNDLRGDFPLFRFAVFCPDLSERTVADAETLRFLLLESGATAVFTNRRELAVLSMILRKHSDAHPEPAKDRIQEIRDFLPWPE